MTVSVAASDVQKNFGEWHDKAYEQPIEITRYGRTTAYLVSAKLYRDMLASYRKAVVAAGISDDEMAIVRDAVVDTDEPYNLDDIPDTEPSNTFGR
jgi:PHD/YefM family antitoxin component YafN of YafNO toxin-antitoxin module